MVTVGKIYSKNCVHCTNMANEWNKMKSHVLKVGGVKVEDFETTRDAMKLENYKKELKEKHGVDLMYDGVPTLFKHGGGDSGKINYYEGERKAKEMAKWALDNEGANEGPNEGANEGPNKGPNEGTNKNKMKGGKKKNEEMKKKRGGKSKKNKKRTYKLKRKTRKNCWIW
jgi:hypothetical protein